MGGIGRKSECRKREMSEYLFPSLPLPTDWVWQRLCFSIKDHSSWWMAVSTASAFTEFQEQLSGFAPLVLGSISLCCLSLVHHQPFFVTLNPTYLFAHNHFGKFSSTALLWKSPLFPAWRLMVCNFSQGAMMLSGCRETECCDGARWDSYPKNWSRWDPQRICWWE